MSSESKSVVAGEKLESAISSRANNDRLVKLPCRGVAKLSEWHTGKYPPSKGSSREDTCPYCFREQCPASGCSLFSSPT